jgi:hypothetical protein
MAHRGAHHRREHRVGRNHGSARSDDTSARALARGALVDASATILNGAIGLASAGAPLGHARYPVWDVQSLQERRGDRSVPHMGRPARSPANGYTATASGHLPVYQSPPARVKLCAGGSPVRYLQRTRSSRRTLVRTTPAPRTGLCRLPRIAINGHAHTPAARRAGWTSAVWVASRPGVTRRRPDVYQAWRRHRVARCPPTGHGDARKAAFAPRRARNWGLPRPSIILYTPVAGLFRWPAVRARQQRTVQRHRIVFPAWTRADGTVQAT